MKNLFLVLFCFITLLGYTQNRPASDSVLIDGVMYKLIEDEKSFFAITNNGDSLYYMVELDNLPKFPGGQSNLFQYLGNNIKYPPTAKMKNISGKVYVNFVIDNTGNLQDINIIKGVHPLLDEEALRVVKGMPQWTPATHRGKNISLKYNLPINFTLRNGSSGSDNRTLGLKYLNKGDYENSIYYYSKIMKVKKNDIDLLYHRGMAYHKYGKDKKAIKDLGKAKSLGSKDAEEYLKTIQQ
jgi:protein TonB